MARIIQTNPATIATRCGQWTVNGLQTSDARGISVIDRARVLKRTLGVKAAASYLRNRGWSVEAAAAILSRRSNRF